MTLKRGTRGQIPSFLVMDVLREANRLAHEGADILHLEVGQPSTGAPEGVVAEATRLLRASPLGYTDALGVPRLRERIAEHYKATYGVAVDPGQVAVTVGASGAFLLSFLAAFDAGDRVALAAPGYPAYRHILTALDIEAVEIEATEEDRFQPTPALLDKVPGRIDGLIVASPSNPTGTMIPPAEFAALSAYCAKRGIRLISDEIYHGITYGMAPTTAASVAPDAFVINSFSKYFSMTGWRLGWMIVPADLVRAVECLAQNMVISAPTLSQAAAIAAFDCHDELQTNVRRYAANRELLLNELPKAGFSHFAPPDGAFYLYADVASLTNDSQEFCRRMLVETGVAAAPGKDFDGGRGNRFVRFSFAGSTETMATAAQRLAAWRR
ncbi:aminotransferase [Aliidongia dinghuensis]|uniref:Aminotransferase n=1 Tax=Aliidongia dinghuensis TaxID=1867774 RepID=A0A8J2YY83_9PROT|nr:aminotransferase class I/II-fold pyridoxal phosphate-dependent enzyme [Aliidongia dinghuensis]GGF31780.1 aminotransferase [Aliidongia dinghuensis]